MRKNTWKVTGTPLRVDTDLRLFIFGRFITGEEADEEMLPPDDDRFGEYYPDGSLEESTASQHAGNGGGQ
jgi:hypothetical protein